VSLRSQNGASGTSAVWWVVEQTDVRKEALCNSAVTFGLPLSCWRQTGAMDIFDSETTPTSRPTRKEPEWPCRYCLSKTKVLVKAFPSVFVPLVVVVIVFPSFDTTMRPVA
jgi:hypothetical protein